MGHPSLFPAEIRELISQLYLSDSAPRDIVVQLRERFGREVTAAQLRQFISRSGLSERRRQLDRKVCSLVSSAKVEAIAKVKSAEPQKVMAEWTTKVTELADKTLNSALSAERPRDLASLTSAMNTSIRVYRLLVDIDSPGSPGSPKISFNYNFSNVAMPRAGTPVPVTPVTSEAGAPVMSCSVEVAP